MVTSRSMPQSTAQICFALGRAISLGATLVADRTDRFFSHQCLLRKIPRRGACGFPGTLPRRVEASSVFEASVVRKASCQFPDYFRAHARPRWRGGFEQRAAFPERAQVYFNDSGSDRFLGDFLLSKATIFCADDGTGAAPCRTICVAVSFFP